MTKQKPRYFIGSKIDANDPTVNQEIEVYCKLSAASKRFWSNFNYDDFIAQEIYYSPKIDAHTGNIKIISLGDFQSNQPYYLISLAEGANRLSYVDVFKRFSDIFKEGLPVEKIIAHGLELKLDVEENK